MLVSLFSQLLLLLVISLRVTQERQKIVFGLLIDTINSKAKTRQLKTGTRNNMNNMTSKVSFFNAEGRGFTIYRIFLNSLPLPNYRKKTQEQLKLYCAKIMATLSCAMRIYKQASLLLTLLQFKNNLFLCTWKTATCSVSTTDFHQHFSSVLLYHNQQFQHQKIKFHYSLWSLG